jgi:hypothetical protein
MTPDAILEDCFQRAEASLQDRSTLNLEHWSRIERICLASKPRSPIRFLMSCLLAKLHNPALDPRKPYTKIGTPDSFSGRNEYDEQYVWKFAKRHRLPVNHNSLAHSEFPR